MRRRAARDVFNRSRLASPLRAVRGEKRAAAQRAYDPSSAGCRASFAGDAAGYQRSMRACSSALRERADLVLSAVLRSKDTNGLQTCCGGFARGRDGSPQVDKNYLHFGKVARFCTVAEVLNDELKISSSSFGLFLFHL